MHIWKKISNFVPWIKRDWKNPPKREAINNFKNYITKAPDGRFAINSVNEITKLDTTLTNYDNLLIAKTYYANGEYEKAKTFLNKTTLVESWPDFAKNEFRLGNIEKARYYTEYGLKDHSDSVENQAVYDVIDNYIASYATRKDGINSLVNNIVSIEQISDGRKH